MKITLDDFLKAVEKSETEKKKEDKNEEKAENANAEVKAETPKEALVRKLNEAQKTYDESPYRTYTGTRTVNYDKRNADLPTDEEIEAQVGGEEGAAAEEKRNKLVNSATDKFGEYEYKAAGIEKAAKEATENILNSYEKAKRKAENSSVANGVGRSSIPQSRIDELERTKDAAARTADAEKEAGISDIEDEVYELIDELSAALGDLDSETAEKINARIETLKEKRDSDKKDNDTKAKNTRASLSKKGIPTEEEDSQEYADMLYQKIKALYEYYYSFGKDAAKEIEADEEFIKDNVGEREYNYIRRFFN